jgi:Tol biopolymer transport system component
VDAFAGRCAGAGAALALLLATACSGSAATRRGGLPPEGSGPGELVYEREADSNRDLYVIPVRGGVPRRLTTHPGTDGLPRWSADGSAVVFTSDRTGNWQLWAVPGKGGEPSRVRTNPHREWQADESPDGRTLAFLSNQDGPECLWLLDRRTGEMRVRVRHGRRSILGNPHWSRDGKRIVFSSNWRSGHQIYVVDAAGGEERRLSPVGGCEPRFHPDGRKVVYVGRRPDRDRSRILEHDLATGEERVLVDWPALNYDPVYSPDGSEIAFASTVAGGGYEVYRQRLADGRASRVTFAGGDARYPDYRPTPR